MSVSHLPLLAADGRPATVAPISAATVGGGLVVVSGQAAVDPATGALLAPDIEGQARIVFDLLLDVLARAGAGPADVLRVECYLARREDFAVLNAAFARAFPAPAPARTTIVCDFAMAGMLVEAQALAVSGSAAPS